MNAFKRFYQIAGMGLAFSATTLLGCQDELIKSSQTVEPTAQKAESLKEDLLPGQAFVKLKEGNTRAVASLSKELIDSQPLTRSGNSPRLEPVFDISGPYKEAMIREGLHLWYKVTFDETVDVHQAIEELQINDNIEIAHGALEFVASQATYTPVSRSIPGLNKRNVPDMNDGYENFNDPLLKKQWHYRLTGTGLDFEVGADINLFEAWKKTTGDKRVVVAVLDSGIDINHPDLKGAMWQSKDGYNGKNFVNNNHSIDPGFHGTHVGGTIAARNNNGEGGGGVAGGNGTPESGVRLMSCQIYGKDKNDGSSEGTANSETIAQAFTWAANNGAVLANCSWGFPFNRDKYPNADYYKKIFEKHGKLIKVGIDYFVKYAGRNPDGVTKRNDCLMAGGVIFFATGNDSGRDAAIIPACDPAVVAVSSFASNYELADYSNTGDWVDICAPGGTTEIRADVARGILSTVPRSFKDIKLGHQQASKYIYPGNEWTDDSKRELYAFAQGTSMATPHVTGIAALMVSHFGAKDNNFTADKLRERLLGAVKAKDIHSTGKNADVIFRNKMGVGYIDAGLALRDPETVKPDGVTALENKSVKYYDATVEWKVTKDSDSPYVTAYAYDLYLSENETQLPNKPTATVYSHEKKEGESLEHTFTGLDSDKTYHVAIQARDRSGNKSTMARTKFTTKLNHAPKITNPLPEKLTIMNTRPYYRYVFQVVDEDNQKWTYKTEGLPKGVTIERKGDNLEMTILVKGTPAKYSFDLILTDELNGQRKEEIQYSIISQPAPSFLGDVFLTVADKQLELDLNEVFQRSFGANTATFKVESNDTNVATVTEDKGKLYITPVARGTATITITADDGYAQTRASFQVRVTDKNDTSEIHALYPLPAHSYIKILTRSKVEKIGAQVTSARGELLIDDTLPVSLASKVATLSVDRLSPGIYHLIIKTERGTSKRTFIKN